MLEIPEDSKVPIPISQDSNIQAQRERTALLVEYFDEADIPPSADESLIPIYSVQGAPAVEIPFDEPGDDMNATDAAASMAASYLGGQGQGGVVPLDVAALMQQFMLTPGANQF